MNDQQCGAGPKAERESQTRAQYEALQMQLEKQATLIDSLENILTPFLESVPPNAEKDPKIEQNLVPFAESLKSSANTVKRGNARLSSILQRLHV